MTAIVQIKLLSQGARMPGLALNGDVGYDLHVIGQHTIMAGMSQDLPTGVAIGMHDDIYGRITGRSSSARKGLLVTEGILDSGYRGELFVHVFNATRRTIVIEDGDRLAQLIFMPAIRPSLLPVDELPPSDRGSKGFGSTGV